ncbi:hypothetical protein HY498_01310 [Candidatus Woesearchaeota archaeon]|nr:hypothetical protein [Candidatus Woesearchaeota archaeon]MBI4154704.1 hypothetical protein [Candidatus Woesearchaeota archaeon]
MWINHFVEFERKQKRVNRLVLGFYHTSGRGVKVFLNQKVKIPSQFFYFDSNGLEECIRKVRNDEQLKDFMLELRCAENADQKFYSNMGIFVNGGIRNYHVLQIDMPHNPSLEDKLPKTFQTGNYDKILRFRGFYPERKVEFSDKMNEIFLKIDNFSGDDKEAGSIDKELKGIDGGNSFQFSKESNSYEIQLNSLRGFRFLNEFLIASELRSMSTLYLDIEKPLWKKEEEKGDIKQREKLIKEKRKNEKIPKKRRTKEDDEKLFDLKLQIAELEDSLTLNISGLDPIYLYEDLFEARISWIGTRWKNACNETEKDIKELYVWDPFNEFEHSEFNNYKIKRFDAEKDLLLDLLSTMKKRRPLLAVAHNGAYDYTQMRMALNDEKEIFDPLIEDVQPRRDFVRYFVQRMREDMIYVDTLWLNKIFYP